MAHHRFSCVEAPAASEMNRVLKPLAPFPVSKKLKLRHIHISGLVADS
jgi:hypothetical protein